MFKGCCEETVVKNEEFYLYKGYSNQAGKRVPIRESQINQTVQQSLQPFRMYARSTEEESMKQIRQKRQMFVDKEFPPGQSSLGAYFGRRVQWVRLSALFDQTQNSQFSTMDFLSLKEGDSYFLASLLALNQSFPLAREVFDEHLQVSSDGAYKLKVSIRGKPQELIIDDYLPVFADNHRRAAFCHIDPGVLWAPLLQKAYAKIQGSYERIGAGYAHEVLVTFSLAPCIYQVIPTDFRQEEQEKCWNTLLEAYEHKFPTVLGSRKRFTCQAVLPNQSYCFKGCKLLPKKNSVEKRVMMWQLPRQRPRHIDSFIEYQDHNNVLSLPLVEFMRNFEIVDVSHYRKNFNSHFYQFKCGPTDPVMYTFKNPENSNVYLTLQRESEEKGRLRMILLNCTYETTFQFISGCKQQVYSDLTLRIDELPIGNYLLLCESQSVSNCILRIYALANLPLIKFTTNKLALLQQTFFQQSRESKHQKSYLSKEHEDWYSFRAMFEELGLGYFSISLARDTPISVEVSVNREELLRQGLEVINKSFRENYYCRLQKGDRLILLFEYVGVTFKAFAFPPHSLQIKLIV